MPRLTVLGGSSISSPGLILALRAAGVRGGLTVVLHGRSADKLQAVVRACRAAAAGLDLTIEGTTDLAAALKGADAVLNQVRVGGLEGRQADEYFPQTLGLIGEETVGAGGFASALRTIPAVLEMCEAIKRYAPEAALINLTNPAGMVHQAMERYAGMHVVSACDMPVALMRRVHQLLEARPGTIEVDYLGMNHLGWATAAIDLRAARANAMPQVLERLEALPNLAVDPDWCRTLGVLPSDYLRYYYHNDRYLPKQPSRRTRATELMEIEAATLASYNSLAPDAGPDQVAPLLALRRPHWYAEVVVPLLTAMWSTTPRRIILQVTNGTQVPDLDPYAVIELPVLVGGTELGPETPSPLPPECMLLLHQNALYERLAVEAIVEHDRAKAVHALVLNPLVGTVDKARAVVDAVWPK